MSRLEHIRDIVMPTLARKRSFGEQAEIVDYKFDESKKLEDLKMSDLIFLTVSLREGKTLVIRKILLKFQPQLAEVRKFAETDMQFFNEIYAYENILPFIDENDLRATFPKFYAGLSGSGLKDYIVIEDLSDDYRTTKGLFLDMDHVMLSLRHLGRFHAYSYAAKVRDPEGFFKKVSMIKETHWLKEKEEDYYQIFTKAFKRSIANMPNRFPKQTENFRKQLERKYDFYTEFVKPEEPMSVICHGDFCKNNIMYRYSEGKAVQAMLIDLATVRYASPIIDISLILFLNLPADAIPSHLDQLLQAYYDALSTTLPHAEVPTLPELKAEFRRRAVYGLLHSLYFLPVSYAALSGDNVFDFPKFCRTESAEERGRIITSCGGEKGAELIGKLVHMCFEEKYL